MEGGGHGEPLFLWKTTDLVLKTGASNGADSASSVPELPQPRGNPSQRLRSRQLRNNGRTRRGQGGVAVSIQTDRLLGD